MDLDHAELLNYSTGARGVHEAFAATPALKFIAGPRELWEWQTAAHSLENGSYLVMLSSMSRAPTEKFDSGDVEAQQCLAAYEVSPSPSGSRIHMTSHLNPNVWGILTRIGPLWNRVSADLIVSFAEGLSKEAKRIAAERQRQRQGRLNPPADGGALQLLVPVPPARNASLSVRGVLESEPKTWLRQFAHLDVPQALNTSSWDDEDFETKVAELHRLLLRLAHNATEAENATFQNGPARDDLEVQSQGESLAMLQLRAMAAIDVVDCSAGGGGLPDINNDGSESGIPFWLTCALAALLLCAMFGLGVCSCCCLRRQLRKRRMRRDVAAALLTEDASMRAANADAMNIPDHA
jgi:hypothetical protein